MALVSWVAYDCQCRAFVQQKWMSQNQKLLHLEIQTINHKTLKPLKTNAMLNFKEKVAIFQEPN